MHVGRRRTVVQCVNRASLTKAKNRMHRVKGEIARTIWLETQPDV